MRECIQGHAPSSPLRAMAHAVGAARVPPCRPRRVDRSGVLLMAMRAAYRVGPLASAIDAGELERWAAHAPPGAEIVYASGVVPPRDAAAWPVARTLADTGAVVLHNVRRDDGRGWDWIARRRGAAAIVATPRHADAPEDDPLDALVLKAIRRRINLGLPMATDPELARECGFVRRDGHLDADHANYRLRRLRAAGLIRLKRGPIGWRRVATIVALGRSTVEGKL